MGFYRKDMDLSNVAVAKQDEKVSMIYVRRRREAPRRRPVVQLHKD